MQTDSTISSKSITGLPNVREWVIDCGGYYTGSEEVTEKPAEAHIYGDMDENGSIDVFNLGLMKRLVLSGEQIAWADCDADGMTGIGDIIAVQKYVLAADGAGRTGTHAESP